MKITTITVSYARTFSLENYGGPRYESIKPETSISAELEEGDDVQVALAELGEIAKASVRAQAEPVLRHYKKQVEDIRASVPGLSEENDHAN